MEPGHIIFLNGASSSGKTSLLHAFQTRLEETYLEFGLDKFIWMLPKRYFYQPLWDDVLGKADMAGEMGHQLVYGMHRAIQTLADCGLNLLVDHVLVEPAWLLDCALRFSDYPAYLIGVYCDLDILEQREQARKDRTLGQARKQFARVHAHGVYDLVVDSGKHTVEENVDQILAYINTQPQPTAFKDLSQQFAPGKA